MRSIRTTIVFCALLTVAIAMQFGTAATASAAVTCKQYDRFISESSRRDNARVCIAPASDYPGYAGWGRVVDTYTTSPSVCGFSLLPFDIDEPRPAIGCLAVMPQPVPTWKWNATKQKWVQKSLDAFLPGKAVYFAPYPGAPGYRLVWLGSSANWDGVIETRHAAFRWYA